MKHVDIWTDGAARGNPGPGGYGAVIKYVDKNGVETRLELKNIDLWERIIKLTEKHKVEFLWVKGHNNNIENERCDTLANIAIDELLMKAQ